MILPPYYSHSVNCASSVRIIAAVHSSTGQEDGDEGYCHEETPLCIRPGIGGEWQTGATGVIGGVERRRRKCCTLFHQWEELDIELKGKKLTQTKRDSLVYLGGAVCGDGNWRERYVEEHRPERTRGEQLRG